jgi:hypothetical protein
MIHNKQHSVSSVPHQPFFPHTHTQVTAFMSLLVLDTRRIAQSRLDCLPCLRVPYRDADGAWVHDDLSSEEDDDYEARSRPHVMGAATGAAAAGAAQDDPSGVFYAPAPLPPLSAAAAQATDSAAASHGAAAMERGQAGAAAAAAAYQGSGGAGAGQHCGPSVPHALPGVSKAGPGLLHGDSVSLQSLLQVCSNMFMRLLSCSRSVQQPSNFVSIVMHTDCNTTPFITHLRLSCLLLLRPVMCCETYLTTV